MVNEPTEVEDLNRVSAFLARRDVPRLSGSGVDRMDALVLCGSAVLSAVAAAAGAFHDGVAARLLVSGGVGHSTAHLMRAVEEHPRYGDVATQGRTEADVLAEILRTHHGIPAGALLVEGRSTNCGENAAFSVDLLGREVPDAQRLLLVQDPTMQRRTHACFLRSLAATGVEVVSHAPFVPRVTDSHASHVVDEQGSAVWSRERFVGLLLGEVRRLNDDEHGYGPRGAGFIDHVDVPDAVLEAYRRLGRLHPGSERPAWS